MFSCPRLCTIALLVLTLFPGRQLLAQETICLQEISLDEGTAAVHGIVVDEKTRQPIVGAEVYALTSENVVEEKGGGAPHAATTLGTSESGDSGEFLIIVPFVETQIRIRITHWGFAAYERSLTIGNRKIIQETFVLVPREARMQGAPDTALQPIFFATDRARGKSSRPENVFGTGRNSHLNYGVATVAVPAPTPPKTPRFGVSFQFMDNGNRDTKLMDVEPRIDFWQRIRAAMNDMKTDEVYIFVHGYDNSFDEAARRAGLIAYAAHLPGPMILYSWPSQESTLKYIADETNIKWSQLDFNGFLDDLARRGGAKTINLIAHSMGNLAVLDALYHFAGRASHPHFGEIILAAPDVDRETYREIALKVFHTVGHITVYGSANDQAIRLSRALHLCPRAGDGGKEIPVVPVYRIDAIDASAVPADLMGHGYLETTDILDDIHEVIEHHYPERDHLTRSQNREGRYWVFNP